MSDLTTLSEVLTDNVNTAVFCTPLTCTKRELRIFIFEKGQRPMFWQEQFTDIKKDLFLKTFPNFSPTSCLSHALKKTDQKIHQQANRNSMNKSLIPLKVILIRYLDI